MKMNIGIVTTWFERGAAYVSRAYMKALQTQGYDVFIYARGGEMQSEGDPAWDLPNVTYGKAYKPLLIKTPLLPKYSRNYIDMLHFEAWLNDNDIDVVIFNEEHSISIPKRTKKLGYFVGAYVDYYTKDTVEQFRAYDFLLCNTKRHYSVFRDFQNCLYIPWGTDIDLFKPKTRECGESTANQVVFFHSAGWGGVNIRKGTDLLVKAFQKVIGGCRLIIHSQVPVLMYGTEIADMIRQDTRIEFIEGSVTAPGLYYLGDVYVYPTRLEGIGLSVPEALACGLPVITTDNAPMNEFVEDGINGLLVRVNETRIREDGYYWPETVVCIEDLARKMQTYVDDRDLLSLHTMQSRESAKSKLNWANNASKLSHILHDISKKTKRTHSRSCLSQRIIWKIEEKYVALLSAILCVVRKTVRKS